MKDLQLIGSGGGPATIIATKNALARTRETGHSTASSVFAADAFFPFTDGVENLIQAGVNAIIQPQGSIRDREIIKLADKTGTVLIFSKTRHFKH